MNKIEAKKNLLAELDVYRTKTYEELKLLIGKQISYEKTGASGLNY